MRMILFLLIASFYSSTAFAYGKYGHVTICEIAYREMTPTTRAEVNRLLAVDGRHTAFNRSCLDADSPRARATEHFLNLDRDVLDITGETCGAADKCVVSAIREDFEILNSDEESDELKALRLKHLGHWVGDVHQPLHVSYADDRGGNSIKKRGRCSAGNLHAVWDNCVIEQKVFNMNRLERLLGWQRFTKAYRAADRLHDDIDVNFREESIDSEVWQWAAESYAVTISPDVGYCRLRSGGCWYDANNKRLDDGEEVRTIQMTDEYLVEFQPTVEERIKRGGVRLGHLLNLAFDDGYAAEF